MGKKIRVVESIQNNEEDCKIIAQGYREAYPPQGKVISVSNRKRKDGKYNCKITLEVEDDE
ncbi:MAG: hypothetical protein AAGJ08_01670 [Cyanobacteria bacterium P01_H01_bin.35]